MQEVSVWVSSQPNRKWQNEGPTVSPLPDLVSFDQLVLLGRKLTTAWCGSGWVLLSRMHEMLHRGLWETLQRNQSAIFCYILAHALPDWRLFVLKDSEGFFGHKPTCQHPRKSLPLSWDCASKCCLENTSTGITAWPYPVYSLNKCVTRSWDGMKQRKNPTKHYRIKWINYSLPSHGFLPAKPSMHFNQFRKRGPRHASSEVRLPSGELSFPRSFNHHLHMPELPKAGQQCLLNRSTTWRHFVLARVVETTPKSFWPSVEGDLASQPHVERVLHIAMAAHNVLQPFFFSWPDWRRPKRQKWCLIAVIETAKLDYILWTRLNCEPPAA